MTVRRGCGTRTLGGAYIELGLSEHGQPIESFLIDPPAPIGRGMVPKIGQMVIERDGLVHVVDHVGTTHYPDVAGFVEEARRFGISRGPLVVATQGLTAASRLLLLHDRAWVEEMTSYRKKEPFGSKHWCPKCETHHEEGTAVQCIGVVWEDVEPGEGLTEMVSKEAVEKELASAPWKGYREMLEVAAAQSPERIVVKQMPSFSYMARRRPLNEPVRYRPALFLSVPIGRIAVVHDPEGGKHADTLKKVLPLRSRGIDVQLVDE